MGWSTEHNTTDGTVAKKQLCASHVPNVGWGEVIKNLLWKQEMQWPSKEINEHDNFR